MNQEQELPKISATDEASGEAVNLTPLPGETSQLSRPRSKTSNSKNILLWLCLAVLLAAGIYSQQKNLNQIDSLRVELANAQSSIEQSKLNTADNIQQVSQEVTATKDDVAGDIRKLQQQLARLDEHAQQNSKNLLKQTDLINALQLGLRQNKEHLQEQEAAIHKGLLALDTSHQQQKLQITQIENQQAQLSDSLEQAQTVSSSQQQELAALTSTLERLQENINALNQPELAALINELRERQDELDQQFTAFRAQMTRSINSLQLERN